MLRHSYLVMNCVVKLPLGKQLVIPQYQPLKYNTLVARRLMASAQTSDSQTLGVKQSLAHVLERIDAATKQRGNNTKTRLVAVSKTKPIELIMEAYNADHRDFGENYVQELVDKAPQLPKDINWHFIGNLQRSNVKKLLVVPNISMIETVDNAKLASRIQSVASSNEQGTINVLIQVNTSGEEQKGGAAPDSVPDLALHIKESCPLLCVRGVMTIGRAGSESDFNALVEARQKLAESMGVDSSELELSMGMSGDFEQAIALGSTNVRVGSTIFGAREYPNKG